MNLLFVFLNPLFVFPVTFCLVVCLLSIVFHVGHLCTNLLQRSNPSKTKQCCVQGNSARSRWSHWPKVLESMMIRVLMERRHFLSSWWKTGNEMNERVLWSKGYWSISFQLTEWCVHWLWDFSSQSVFYCKIWTLDLLYAGVIEPNWSGPVYPELWAYPIMHWAHQYHLSDSDWLAFFLRQVWTVSQHLCFFCWVNQCE